MTVYVSIGNSDDKLTQREWSYFVNAVHHAVSDFVAPGKLHGAWFSVPASPWQNAVWCFEVDRPDELKGQLSEIAGRFGQESIAWAVATTEFIKAPYGQFVP